MRGDGTSADGAGPPALDLAASGVPALVFALDEGRSVQSANGAFTDLSGHAARDLAGTPVAELLDLGRLSADDRAAFERALATRTGGQFEMRLLRSDGRAMVCHATILVPPMRPFQALVLLHDLSGQEDGALVLGEMQHRLSNLIAVIAGLMQILPVENLSAVQFRDDLSQRLAALTRAQGLLLGSGLLRDTEQIELGALVDAVIGPIAPDGRLDLDGQAVWLDRQAGLHAALVLHELAANAVKHGAFSGLDGNVRLAWRRVDGAVELDWTEREGPPAREGDAPGFGTHLLAVIIAQSTRPDAGITFAEAGLSCRIDLPRVEG